MQIDAQGGPIVAVATPFDADLAKINTEICANTLVFGRREVQSEAKGKAAAAGALHGPEAADRASYLGRNGAAASYDLLQSVKDGKVKLEEVKKDELPEELKKLNVAQQKEYLEKLDRRRQELQKQAIELDQKRSAFVAQKQKEAEGNRARDSFDQNVMRILQRQAARANIQYAIDEKK